MSDYNPAENALAATQQATALDAEERKQTAYNALANTYGVALAGDPDTAEKDQEITQRNLTNPIAVQQAQANLTGTNLTNTGQDQTNTYNAAANPLKLTGLGLANDKTTADINNTYATTANTKAETNKTNTLLPGEVAQQGATLKQTGAQTGLLGAEAAKTGVETQQARLSLNTARAAQDRQTAMGLLAGLSDTAANGGDIGAAFDKIAPLVAQYEGVDQAHIAPLRAKLVADPIGTINSMTDAIHAANLASIQAAGGKTGGAAALATMVKLGNQQMTLGDGLRSMQLRTSNAQTVVQQMQALTDQMSSLPTVAAVKAKIPGTPEYQFANLAQQLKSNLSLNDLQAMKNTGLSMGRVTNAEMAAAGNAIANTDIGLPLATLKANLTRANGFLNLTGSNIQGDLSGMATGPANGHIQLKPKAAPAQVGSYQNGTVYTDKSGNKATTSDGGKTWKPVQ